MTNRKAALRIALIVASALVLLAVPAAFAGKGKPGGGGGAGGGGSTTGSSLSLVLMDGATQARHGNRITFNVSTTATDRPYVGVRCYQGTGFVLDGYVGFFPTYMFDPWLTLDSPYWAPGVQTNCTARLFYYDGRGNQKVLTTISFAVAT